MREQHRLVHVREADAVCIFHGDPEIVEANSL